jgi:hypothetical protein
VVSRRALQTSTKLGLTVLQVCRLCAKFVLSAASKLITLQTELVSSLFLGCLTSVRHSVVGFSLKCQSGVDAYDRLLPPTWIERRGMKDLDHPAWCHGITIVKDI